MVKHPHFVIVTRPFQAKAWEHWGHELPNCRLSVIRRIPQMFAQGSSEEKLCVICEGLFVPQRDHGIHTGGAACGNVAGRQRSKREHHGDADISERIAGTYTE